MANTVEVKVPDIGGYDDVPVIEVLVAVGDTVAKDQGLATPESDKATREVPSSPGGVVKELKVKVGDTLSEGSVVLVLEVEGAPAGAAPAPAKQAGPAAPAAPAAPQTAPAAAAGAAPGQADPATGGLVEATVPDIGGYDDVPVIEVLVAVGDTVAKDQGLVTLESDKATMEVPSSHAGVVRELKVKVGDTLSEGAVVALIEAEGDTPAYARTPEKVAPGSKPPVAPSHRAPAGPAPE